MINQGAETIEAFIHSFVERTEAWTARWPRLTRPAAVSAYLLRHLYDTSQFVRSVRRRTSRFLASQRRRSAPAVALIKKHSSHHITSAGQYRGNDEGGAGAPPSHFGLLPAWTTVVNLIKLSTENCRTMNE